MRGNEKQNNLYTIWKILENNIPNDCIGCRVPRVRGVDKHVFEISGCRVKHSVHLNTVDVDDQLILVTCHVPHLANPNIGKFVTFDGDGAGETGILVIPNTVANVKFRGGRCKPNSGHPVTHLTDVSASGYVNDTYVVVGVGFCYRVDVE